MFELLFGSGATTDEITAEFRSALSDESVRAIVLDIDSPGGSAFGITELAAEIRAGRGQKPIVAVANSMAASAAYWLGSAADEFYTTPGGVVGSIGVFTTHMDLSGAAEREGIKPTIISAGKYKTEGHEFAPLDDEARAAAQHFVDSYYDQFVKDVARNRGATEAAVRNGYGEGRALPAKDAVKAGLVDGVRTFDQVLARIGQTRSRPEDEDVAATERFTFTEQAEHALTSVQGFISRSQSLADLRAQEGRPLGQAAKGALVSFVEALGAEIKQAEQLLQEQPDARVRQDADAFAQFRLQLLRDELAAERVLEMST